MNKLRLAWAIMLFLGIGFNVSAQKEIVTQSNGWWMYFGNHRLSDNWGLHTEYQWRRHEFISTWQQSLMRVGVDYFFKNNSSLTAGYGWIKSFPYGEQPVNQEFTEHRIWQQWILNQRAGRLYVNHRYRLEQRFLERPAQDDYVFRQRVRYRLMLTMPIGAKDLQDNSLFVSVYAEPFLGFGEGIGRNILDQNRLSLTLGYRFNPNVNLQAGYLNQYIVKPDGIQQERNHNFQLGLTYNLDLRQSE
ncbi:MAG: DUF2490 domain-containing protein [Saprospiraceae bacterium]|nr:DUF2490 domain-containing protein [Saprospiraceae bacterium]